MKDGDAYTPGPWAIAHMDSNPALGTWMKGVTIYSEPTGKRIADTCWLNASNDHNANLIAAAPDLLAGLKLVVALYEEENASLVLPPGSIRVAPLWVSTIRAAIAKAEKSTVNPLARE